jgi:hypothetical protein
VVEEGEAAAPRNFTPFPFSSVRNRVSGPARPPQAFCTSREGREGRKVISDPVRARVLLPRSVHCYGLGRP